MVTITPEILEFGKLYAGENFGRKFQLTDVPEGIIPTYNWKNNIKFGKIRLEKTGPIWTGLVAVDSSLDSLGRHKRTLVIKCGENVLTLKITYEVMEGLAPSNPQVFIEPQQKPILQRLPPLIIPRPQVRPSPPVQPTIAPTTAQPPRRGVEWLRANTANLHPVLVRPQESREPISPRLPAFQGTQNRTNVVQQPTTPNSALLWGMVLGVIVVFFLMAALVLSGKYPDDVLTVAKNTSASTPAVEILPSFTPIPATPTLIPPTSTATHTVTSIPPTPLPTRIPPTPSFDICPGTPTSHLWTGWQGTVATSNLRLRDNPGLRTQITMRDLPVGTIFTVIGGPQCADGYTWWNIQITATITGWAAEGSTTPFETYYLVPKY